MADAVLYLSVLLDKHSIGAVSTAYSALKWIHGFLPCQHNPLDSALCRNLLEAGKRQRTHPIITKKEPVSVDLVADIVRSYAHQSATLKDMRFATMCVLSFAGLFRSKGS